MELNSMDVLVEEEALEMQKEYSQWKENNLMKANEEGNFGYSFIFTGCAKKFKQAKLSANAIVTYLGIMELANNEKGTMFMSNAKLSEVTGITGGSLSNAIAQLEEAGFIKRYMGDDGRGRFGRKIQLKGY
ncbi:Marr family transcriptional regulator [Bacillus phage BCPST]|uniref:Marr family transcriptional regulator n=1 Tax=Bacillus phage BCPST TaxID=2801506 RepID=A0AAE7P5M5_9CAUD|nr:Marr family transcriptional regulator [Bacillus phage BCPST]QQO38633.1 Marr family transcriptional regulator [Bacillus phage BCPST]QSJ04223.1 hypothetical protein BCP6_018 [Bacillus phage BCP6]